MQSSAPTAPDLIPPPNVTTPMTPTVSPAAPPPNMPALTRAAAPNSQSTLHPLMHASPKMQCHISQSWDNLTHLSLQQRTHMYPPPITPIALVQFPTLRILHCNTKIQHSHHHHPNDQRTPPQQRLTQTMLGPNGQLANTSNTNNNANAGPSRPSDNRWNIQNYQHGPPRPNPNNIPLLQSQTLFQYGFVPNPPTQFQPVSQFFNPNDYANEAW